ncbi:MAG TPA: hypothetical protein VKJ47_14175 [Candidatus Binatia bacterium]|nr:hypothetical protein [Candidatus Binatia bacterium]
MRTIILVSGSLIRRAVPAVILLLMILLPAWLLAGTVPLPHTFRNGDVADANEVNANFLAVKSAVDDNAAHIATLSGGGGLMPLKASDVRTLAATFPPVLDVSMACPSNGFGGISSSSFNAELLPGGGGVFEDFSIPSGQVFVVTSFDWTMEGAPPSQLVTVELALEGTTGFNLTSALSPATSDSGGRAGSQQTLGPGIILKSGNLLCLRTRTSGSIIMNGHVQGFFAADS